jgi:aminopeptidase 2
MPIPLEIAAARGRGGDLLRTKHKMLKIPSNFFSINAGQSGFFRVAYSPTRLRTISEEMCRGNLSVEERIGLLSNAAALCFSGHPSMPTPQLLSLILQFENEESYFVWKIILQVLQDFKKALMWESEMMKTAFERFWRHLVQQCLYRKGQIIAEDDVEEQTYKSMMFANAGGDDKVFEAASMLFDRFVLSVETHINPNLRAESFKLILGRKGKKEVSFLTNAFHFLH